jgi:hypothetical protein
MAIPLPPLVLYDLLQGEIYLLVALTDSLKNVKTGLNINQRTQRGGRIITQNRNISVVTCSS